MGTRYFLFVIYYLLKSFDRINRIYRTIHTSTRIA